MSVLETEIRETLDKMGRTSYIIESSTLRVAVVDLDTYDAIQDTLRACVKEAECVDESGDCVAGIVTRLYSDVLRKHNTAITELRRNAIDDKAKEIVSVATKGADPEGATWPWLAGASHASVMALATAKDAKPEDVAAYVGYEARVKLRGDIEALFAERPFLTREEYHSRCVKVLGIRPDQIPYLERYINREQER